LTISELSQKLGIPEDKIKERLKLELELGQIKISDIEFNDNNALIKGSVN
jgi:DNA-binding Lrp family transcriptional regulator